MSALRWLSALEGASVLALWLIAVPAKYLWHQPAWVRVLGPAHGVLFLALGSAIVHAWADRRIAPREAGRVLLWSLVPFGFVWADRALRSRA